MSVKAKQARKRRRMKERLDRKRYAVGSNWQAFTFRSGPFVVINLDPTVRDVIQSQTRVIG